MQAAQTPTSELRFVTPVKESSMSTLWQEEEFEQICSRESLTEKVADVLPFHRRKHGRCAHTSLTRQIFSARTALFLCPCAHLSPSTCKLLFMFLHLIRCCPSPYCIPHAIIKCRMTILISYFSCLAARVSPRENCSIRPLAFGTTLCLLSDLK